MFGWGLRCKTKASLTWEPPTSVSFPLYFISASLCPGLQSCTRKQVRVSSWLQRVLGLLESSQKIAPQAAPAAVPKAPFEEVPLACGLPPAAGEWYFSSVPRYYYCLWNNNSLQSSFRTENNSLYIHYNLQIYFHQCHMKGEKWDRCRGHL